ncbi:MAG: hypothetical protein ACRDT0_01750 [Pseudonocardiaceae bacterium]
MNQHAAAPTDAYERLARLGSAHGSPLRIGPVPRWLTPHLRQLAQALTIGTVRRYDYLGTSPAVANAAVWDPGHLTCTHCTHRLTPDTDEDTTCDRCRRQAEPIHPGAIAVGPILLTFGLCRRCHARTEPAALSRRAG